MQGGLVKMSLTAYGDESFTNKLVSIDVLLNPDSCKISKGVNVSGSKQQKSANKAQDFEKYGKETLSFSIVFDGTGVLPGTNSSTVKDLVNDLDVVIYNYNGNIQRPNFVVINWGDLLFKGQLSSYSLNYTLFSPNGDPLRVKIDLSFVNTLKIDRDLVNSNSRKLSELIKAKEGDNVTSLCDKKYSDALVAPLVAKLNELNSLRKDIAGTLLKLPKII